MGNAQRRRVQRRPIEDQRVGVRRAGPEISDAKPLSAAVGGIDRQRMPDGREVDPDLVPAAGAWMALAQRVAPESLLRIDPRLRRPRALPAPAHPASPPFAA